MPFGKMLSLIKCWIGNILQIAKRQQNQLPDPVLCYLVKYITSLKSRFEDTLEDLGMAIGSLAVRGKVLGYWFLGSECRVICQILCVITYSESCRGYKTASVSHREKVEPV